MSEQFPEQMKCPVCLVIPSKEIFQCKHGHILCHTCVQSLLNCPQCREHMGVQKIRNRALEDLLDIKKFECPHKANGCNVKLSRRDLPEHLKTCTFGDEFVHFCKNLGYKCNYCFPITRDPEEGIKHLIDQHFLISITGNVVEVVLNNFKTFFDLKITHLWNPIIIKACDTNAILIPKLQSQGVSFSCILVEKQVTKKLRMDFCIKSKLQNAPALEWSTKPIGITKSEVILQYPPLFVSLDLLEKCYLEYEKLAFNVVVREENSEDALVQNEFPVNAFKDWQFCPPVVVDPQNKTLNLATPSSAELLSAPYSTRIRLMRDNLLKKDEEWDHTSSVGPTSGSTAANKRPALSNPDNENSPVQTRATRTRVYSVIPDIP